MGNKIIFDIGTRSVCALKGDITENNKLLIEKASYIEYSKKFANHSLIDDIKGISDTADLAYKNLEEGVNRHISLGFGAREGKIIKKSNKLCFEDYQIIDEKKLIKLKRATKKDIYNIAKENKLYPINYSVIGQIADKRPVKNLLNLSAKEIDIQIYSTCIRSNFLIPKLNIIKSIGLDIDKIFFEGISTYNLFLEKGIDYGNILLIDIGGGTTDITFIRDGYVAYIATFPIAGDDITEAISKRFFLDFNTAEYVKKNYFNNDLSVKNLADDKININKEQVEETIEGIINQICLKIKKAMENLGNIKIDAIFCFGGGSKIKFFHKRAAEIFNFDRNRIKLIGLDYFNDLIINNAGINGSEYITPIAMLYDRCKGKGVNRYEININSKERIILEESLTLDYLMELEGIKIESGFSESIEKGISYYINDELKIKRGRIAEPAEVYINNKKAFLDDNIYDGDKIEIINNNIGPDVKLKLKDIIEEYSINILDEEDRIILKIKPEVYKGYEKIEEEYEIKDMDRILIKEVTKEKIKQALRENNICYDRKEIEIDNQRYKVEYLREVLKKKDKNNYKIYKLNIGLRGIHIKRQIGHVNLKYSDIIN